MRKIGLRDWEHCLIPPSDPDYTFILGKLAEELEKQIGQVIERYDQSWRKRQTIIGQKQGTTGKIFLMMPQNIEIKVDMVGVAKIHLKARLPGGGCEKAK